MKERLKRGCTLRRAQYEKPVEGQAAVAVFRRPSRRCNNRDGKIKPRRWTRIVRIARGDGSTNRGQHAIVCAMKLSPVLAKWIPVTVGCFFLAVASLADPTASPSPTAKVDPIEANDPEYAANFDSLYQKTWGGGAIPEKYKQLTGVSISIVQRCETCLGWHMKQAVRLGAKKKSSWKRFA
jgi:AhpD family alkylhydroperoxidase